MFRIIEIVGLCAPVGGLALVLYYRALLGRSQSAQASSR